MSGTAGAPGARHRGARGARPALADEVYEHLVAAIMDQRVTPGAPLRTQALADELGTSLTPVREALARLEPTGLIVREPRRGYAVAPMLEPDEIDDVLELRAVVEPYLARRACQRADGGDLAALDAALERQVAAPTGPDYDTYRPYLEADWEVHRLIAQASGSAVALATFTSLSLFLKRYQFFERHVVTDAEQTRAEHAAIVAAVRAGDPDAAATTMGQHLAAVRERVVPPRPDGPPHVEIASRS